MPVDTSPLVPAERILRSILLIRGQKVMLDADLADLYDVETRVLVQAVKRNQGRFPEDFMFQLDKQEWANLRSQSVISKQWGGRRYTHRPTESLVLKQTYFQSTRWLVCAAARVARLCTHHRHANPVAQ